MPSRTYPSEYDELMAGLAFIPAAAAQLDVCGRLVVAEVRLDLAGAGPVIASRY